MNSPLDKRIPRQLARPTIYIDRAALRHNAELSRQLAPQAKMLAMVKANGYGHGAELVASTLSDTADAFGVARTEEGVALRAAGVEAAIVVMSPLLDEDDFAALSAHQLTAVISCEVSAQQQLRDCIASGIDYWVKFDSGMHRLGLRDSKLSPQQLHGKTLISHLKSAERSDPSTTDAQLRQFCKQLQDHSIEEGQISLANSAALLQASSTKERQQHWQNLLPQYRSEQEIIRPGVMLYGADPLEKANSYSRQLQPAMTFVAPVLTTRQLAVGDSVGYNGRWRAQQPSTIATIAVGYGDGYPRHAIDGTPVLINGQRAKLAGTVSMDMITVDITDLLASGASVNPGDCATLWGPALPVEEVARSADSISYQLFTAISERVARQTN